MRRTARIAAAGLLILGLLVPAGSALASGGTARVEKSGPCSGSARWDLKAKPDDGMIEVEFEVDSNRAGQTWHVTLLKNGNSFFSGDRVTKAPSGSFTVARRTPNPAGSDTIKGRAVFKATGQTCVGHVTLG